MSVITPRKRISNGRQAKLKIPKGASLLSYNDPVEDYGCRDAIQSEDIYLNRQRLSMYISRQKIDKQTQS